MKEDSPHIAGGRRPTALFLAANTLLRIEAPVERARASGPSSERKRTTGLLGLIMLVLSAPASMAQHTSTRDGIYSAAQAERGRITYAGMCKACHSPASHPGVTCAKYWKGKTLAQLFTYVSTAMPKSNPGSMNADEYADVIAYILKMNTFPATSVDMPADSAQLASVMIEMPLKARKSASATTKLPSRP